MLTGKQKRYLRAKSHHEKPIVQVGKSGVTDNMITQIDDALEKRELIKVKLLQNCLEDKHVVAETIADQTEAQIVQIIGNNIVFYKESLEHKQIVLPE